MDGGAWWAAVHGVTKSRTRLSNFTFTFHFHALEKELATHSRVLAWRIPGMGEPGGLQSLGSHRVGHDWSDLAAAAERPTTPPYQLLGPQQEGWVRRAFTTRPLCSRPRIAPPPNRPHIRTKIQPRSSGPVLDRLLSRLNKPGQTGVALKERHPAQACQDRILNVQKRAPHHFCVGVT